jgi:HK97 gp10 family phage protein
MARRMGGNGVTVTVVHNDIPQYAASMAARVEAVVAKAAHDIEAHAKGRAPVDTGFLRNSIGSQRVGDAHWRISARAHYAVYVESGTRHMAAQPYMRPAADAVRPGFRKAVALVLGAS